VKRIALWDGILPLVVIATAPVLKILAPKQEGLQIIVNVAVPGAAFLVRLAIGSKYFETHPHRPWQGWVFFVAIIYLVWFDALMIVMRLVGTDSELEYWFGFLVLYLPYLAMMGLAFLPHRELIAVDSANELVT
jgi:hypothetical protein